MIDSNDNFRIIIEKLDALRRAWARFILLNGLLRALTLVVLVLFLLISAEGFRYFDSTIRLTILRFTSGFLIIFLLTPIVLAALTRSNRMSAYSNINLARTIGRHFPDIGDRLLNGLQLHEMTQVPDSNYSKELANFSVKKLAAEIVNRQFTEMIPRSKLRKSLLQFLSPFLLTIVIVFTHSSFFSHAADRFFHPRQSFNIPLPFEIQAVNGSFGVFGGDSVKVALQCRGEYPERLNFRAIHPDYFYDETISPDENGFAEIELGVIRHTIIYECFAENRSLFKPWKRISSGRDTIYVTDRPEILVVKTQIDPPRYTSLPAEIRESNNLELMMLPGSELTLSVASDKEIKKAELHLASGKIRQLNTRAKTATGNLSVFNEDEFTILIYDENDVSNINPMIYKIRIIPDNYPDCQLISPDSDIELTEAMDIPLGIRISDDFGFSKALIRYRLIKQYSPDRSIVDSLEFPIPDLQLNLQELYFGWSVEDLRMAPEDAVEFQVIVYDNDPVNGPKSAASRALKARFPSLNEMFSDFYKQQDDVTDQGEEILRELENRADILEEISREMLKNPELTWEQKNQLSKEIEQTKEAGEKVSQMAEQLDEMIRESRKNKLFDEETLEKYSQLQQSFQEIMTPELREAMEKLQKALEKMDQKSVRNALKQFQINREQFSKELDRMLKLLERVKIEQSVDEMVRRLEDLLERQEQISEDIEQAENSDRSKMDQIANAEKTVERDTDVLLDVMERTSEDMQEFPMMPARDLQKQADDMKNSGMQKEMRQTRNSLKNGDRQKAANHSQKSQRQLQQYLENMRQFRADFNAEQMQQLMSDFRRVIYKTMQVSQSQEKMSAEIKRTPRQSEQLMDVAVKQQQIQQNLSSVIADLIKISDKTFGLSPKVGKGFGQAAGNMNKAIREMEERNTSAASKSAGRATAAINQAALTLINAMNNLQQSGSASGFEQYMEQLQKMAGQQQGINNETQMLGMGQGGQQQAMQRLAARQQQLRKSLEELQNEMSQSAEQQGDLGGIAKDMEDVARDLKRNRILRETMERQQRILSRLLDAQKSLRTQDFKKERKSVTAEDLMRESPGELPADLGERRTVLKENLEKALKEGYNRETEELIRQYFEIISSDTDGSNSSKD